jgi:putative membrane protein
LLFITVGTFAMLAAMSEHQCVLRQIQHDDYLYRSGRSLGLMVAAALILIGIIAFVGILLD